MTSQITTLDPVSTTLITQTILAKAGYTCSLLTLTPGDETPRGEAKQSEEQLLFVVEGEVTVRFQEINTIVGQHQALLVRKDEDYVLAASSDGAAKILRVDVPSRQVITPQIITFDR